MANHGTESYGPGRIEPLEAAKVTKAITWVSVSVALVLMAAKLMAFMITGSISLLASFADSALDFVASVMAFFAVRYASEPADEEHRFGHGKAESFASLFQAVLVAISAALVAREAVDRLLHPQPIVQGNIALAVMLMSIILTLGLVWLQGRAIKKSGSLVVTGDQAHYKADLFANLSVMVGIALATSGNFGIADALVGLGISVWLFFTAWEVAKAGINQMMDRELPNTERELICDITLAVEGVYSIHELRTRASGSYVHMQFHVDLEPNQTLAAAHKIVVEIERKLLETWPAADILIHPDPKGEAEPHGTDHFRREGGKR